MFDRQDTRPTTTSAELVVAPTAPRRGQMVVRVEGDIDTATAPRLLAALEQAMTAVAAEARAGAAPPQGSGAPLVVCDLDAVAFLGAAGLSVLHEAAAFAAARGVVWRVVATTRPVQRVLHLTRMDEVVPLSPRPPHQTPDAA